MNQVPCEDLGRSNKNSPKLKFTFTVLNAIRMHLKPSNGAGTVDINCVLIGGLLGTTESQPVHLAGLNRQRYY